MYQAHLPADLAELLETERETGEQLLWAGRPDPLRAVGSGWGIFIFAVPWTAFALFWEAMVLHLGFTPSVGTPQPVAWGMALFGLPFVLIGFALLSSPLVAFATARRTVYVVTTKRILVITGTRDKRATHAFVPQYIGDLKRTERGDGSGDLTIVAAPKYAPGTVNTATTGMFHGIPDVREVERIVRQAFFPDGYSATAAPGFGVGGYMPGER